jgi:hypothetical protein
VRRSGGEDQERSRGVGEQPPQVRTQENLKLKYTSTLDEHIAKLRAIRKNIQDKSAKKPANKPANKSANKPANKPTTNKRVNRNSNWNNTVWANQQKRNTNAITAFKMPNYYANSSNKSVPKYNLYSNELYGINTIFPPVSFKNKNGRWKTTKQLSKERNEKAVTNNMRNMLKKRQVNARMARMKKYVEGLPSNHGFFKTNRNVAYKYMVTSLHSDPKYFNAFKKYVESKR